MWVKVKYKQAVVGTTLTTALWGSESGLLLLPRPQSHCATCPNPQSTWGYSRSLVWDEQGMLLSHDSVLPTEAAICGLKG